MFRSLLVPLDGSSFGEHALPHALSIARRSAAGIQIMHVHALLDATYAELQVMGDTLDARLRGQERIYLEKTAQQLRDAAPVHVSPVSMDGHVATAIRHQAAETKADLVVMTTHARGAFRRFWLGSVTDELIRDLHIPLLLVHPQDHPADFHKDFAPKRFLIPLDGTPLAEQILEPAVHLAKLFQAEFTLLRVIQPVLPMTLPVGLGTLSEMAHHMAEDIAATQGKIKDEAAAYLESVAGRLRGQGLQGTCHVAIAEQPGVAILEEAKSLGADLIALETHGRRGLSRLLVGSVADKVLRGSNVPLLVHRPKA